MSKHICNFLECFPAQNMAIHFKRSQEHLHTWKLLKRATVDIIPSKQIPHMSDRLIVSNIPILFCTYSPRWSYMQPFILRILSLWSNVIVLAQYLFSLTSSSTNKQTKLFSIFHFSLAQHVSTVRPWSHASSNWSNVIVLPPISVDSIFNCSESAFVMSR